MNDTTKNQTEIVKHIARNGWFGTDANGKDYEDCEVLSTLGILKRYNAPSWSGDDFIYWLSAPQDNNLE